VFVVGARPDLASVVSELTLAAGGAGGDIQVELTDAKGSPVKPVPGAKVYLGTERAPEILSIVASGDGTLHGSVPLGNWVASYAPSVGRRAAGAGVPVQIKSGTSAKVT